MKTSLRKGVDPSVPYDPTDPVPRAIVLPQPAATLVVHGVWPILPLKYGADYRGRLHVVSSLRWDDTVRAVCNAPPYRASLLALGYGRDNPLPLGSILGYVQVTGCECYNHDESHEYEETEDHIAYRLYYGSSYMRNYYWSFDGQCAVGWPLSLPDRRPGLFRISAECAARVRGAAVESRSARVLDAPDTVKALGADLLRERK